MCSALQDPVSWGEVASFDMSEVATPPRHSQVGFAGLQQERTMDGSIGRAVSNAAALSGQEKNCTPFALGGVTSLTPISSSKPTQISVWRRRRKERGDTSPLCDRTGSSFLENISNSPKKTPTKSLPFTPSRVNEAFYLLYGFNGVVFGHVTNRPCLLISSDLQPIRNRKPEPGHPCPHLYSCLWTKVSHQHTVAQRDHTQAPERERWVKIL